MKVLIATQEEYVPFIMDTIQPYDNTEHIIMMNFHKPTSDWVDYDVGISFMWDRKIQKFELDIAPWINFHPGPLPEYKGRNLCYHAIMNGEKEFGATVHYMDENFDTGDIIEIFKFRIHPWYTAEDLSNKVIDTSKKIFVEYLPIILENRVPKGKPNIGGTYYKKSVIVDTLDLSHDPPLSRFIRAITYKDFHPRLIVGGELYEVRKI